MKSKPVKFTVGMRTELTLYSHGPHYGTIIGIHEDACVVRLDEPIEMDPGDGTSPSVVAVPFNELRLMDAIPDTGAAGDYLPSAKVKVIAPGDKINIDVGDGNGDKSGRVVYCLPECCVVKLDRIHHMRRYVAADWHLVQLLPQDGEDEEAQAVADAMDAGLNAGEE